MKTQIEQEGRPSSKTVIRALLAMMAVTAAAVLFVSAPAERLLGDSLYSIRSAFHGLSAGVFMVTSTIGLYQAFRLWGGLEINIREMEIGSFLNAAACFLTILSGNWIYIPYRAAGGPRAHFLETIPEIHKIFFEFKEYAALFTLPLAVTAAYVIWFYADRINKNKSLREITAVLLALIFFYFVTAFGLGAAITKLKSV